MPRQIRSNVPATPLRWSIERAGIEFKVASVSLRKALRAAGIEPDQAGYYSTSEICRCLYGDLHAQKVQKERELVRKYTLENQITEGDFLSRSELSRGLAMIADAMTSRIMSADVERSVKEDLLNDLSTVPIVLANVANAQTKLRRGGNGSRPEED